MQQVLRGCLLLIAMVGSLAGSLVGDGARADEQKLLHAERSLYREVLVYEGDHLRCMCFTRNCRVGRQSCMDMRAPDRIQLNYPRMMLGSLLINPQPRTLLLIGLGGGTLPRALQQTLPELRMDVVEIDPAVVSVAAKYFDFKANERIRVIEADGRVFVKRALREGRRYDIVMLDAFDHEYIPEHLLTREFLQEVKSLLAPGGILAANTFSSSRLYDHESTTYAAVFGEYFNLKRDNRVILYKDGGLPAREQLTANSVLLAAPLRPLGVVTSDLLPMFSTRVDWDKRARVLTDQYSPANLLNTR
jgi:spermidine synthase